MRQSLKRQRRNTQLKRAMKNDIKAVMRAIASSDNKLQDKLKSAQSNIDKAANAGLIHANKAARTKAQLVKAAKGNTQKATPKANETKAKASAKKPADKAKPAAKKAAK